MRGSDSEAVFPCPLLFKISDTHERQVCGTGGTESQRSPMGVITHARGNQIEPPLRVPPICWTLGQKLSYSSHVPQEGGLLLWPWDR